MVYGCVHHPPVVCECVPYPPVEYECVPYPPVVCECVPYPPVEYECVPYPPVVCECVPYLPVEYECVPYPPVVYECEHYPQPCKCVCVLNSNIKINKPPTPPQSLPPPPPPPQSSPSPLPPPRLDPPVEEQLLDVDIPINSNPPLGVTIALSSQHCLVMLGTIVIIPTITVPFMGGGNVEKAQMIQTLMFVSGLNTLIQTWFGTRLPVVIRGSFKFIILSLCVASAQKYYQYDASPDERFLKTMRVTQGALMVSSILPVLLGFLGIWQRVVRFLSLLSAMPVVALVGLGLHEQGFPLIKLPYPMQWGQPSIEVGDVFVMLAAAFVAMVESTGSFISAARYGGATHPPASVLSRGIGLLGFAIFLDGLFGTGVGSTVSVEKVGLLAQTRVGSRRVIQISAVFTILFSVFGKFGAIIASVPLPIVGGLYCVLFPYTSSAGFGLLQYCNLNSFRSKFIMGFSFFMGFSVPRYFSDYVITSGHGPVNTPSNSFNKLMQVIFTSPATVGGIVSYF